MAGLTGFGAANIGQQQHMEQLHQQQLHSQQQLRQQGAHGRRHQRGTLGVRPSTVETRPEKAWQSESRGCVARVELEVNFSQASPRPESELFPKFASTEQ